MDFPSISHISHGFSSFPSPGHAPPEAQRQTPRSQALHGRLEARQVPRGRGPLEQPAISKGVRQDEAGRHIQGPLLSKLKLLKENK